MATRDDLEAIIAKDGPAIIKALVGLAKGGDTAALRMVADRLLPVRERVLELSDFPEIREVKDLPIAAAYITRCVAQGRVTPSEGSSLMGLLSRISRAPSSASSASLFSTNGTMRLRP
jgi:hypothetical protein